MESRSRSLAQYWRNSLADALMHTGCLKEKDLDSFEKVNPDTLKNGHISQEIVDRLFAGESEDVEQINVVFRPWLYESRREHGLQHNNNIAGLITPICTRAILSRGGYIFPQDATIIPRDLLEPLEHRSYAIGSIDALDAYLTIHPMKAVGVITDKNPDEKNIERFRQQWKEYLQSCEELLGGVAKDFFEKHDGFLQREYSLIRLANSPSNVTKHIIDLYDHMQQLDVQLPLFETYTQDQVHEAESCLPAHAEFTGRLAHSSDRFALADEQRDVLSHLLQMRNGEILAVNGPPGTGKTTLLLSVVATLWTKMAIQGGDAEPPVIMAASSNNQAVTNVIDAFEKDFSRGEGPLAGRWLPDLKSYGAYFPSKEKEKTKKDEYQTRSFFESIESPDYVERAEKVYVAAGEAAFLSLSNKNIQAIVDKLHESLLAEIGKLALIASSWKTLEESRESERNELGPYPEKKLAELEERVRASESIFNQYKKTLKTWENWRAHEPVWYAFFAWIPLVASKRLRLARICLRDSNFPQQKSQDWKTIDQIESCLQKILSNARTEVDQAQKNLQRARDLHNATKQALHSWSEALRPLNLEENAKDIDLSIADAHADTEIRFTAFQLATHYWEGRWLLEMKGLGADIYEEQKRKGKVAERKRWKRRMKLCPCAVSTFFMLPQLMQVSKYVGPKVWETDYLYDFVDLLIVDEAGQALPEVSGASFSLAQKALVIGDTQQIDPIWSIPPRVDIGNLIAHGLLSEHDYMSAYERLCDLGKTASRGSVMLIAQQSSRYHYDRNMARGMFLYDHRRCYNEIIEFSNNLCYQGKLRPLRGAKPLKDGELPALGYLHIDGMCSVSGGSRENFLEAETIAAWIKHHEAKLLSAYNAGSLKSIVGVITPFSGQVAAIVRACKKIGLSVGGDDGIAIGTVHSFQGAERPIIIFSSVYSKHADGSFIDRSTSMLNVAVSRAKDSFLVFGDMDVFELISSSKPRGLLAGLLFKNADSALKFDPLPRHDFKNASSGIRTLRDAEQHDAFLRQIFAVARKEIHIVTPWIVMDRVQEIGAMTAMRDATVRGVKITVYTDPGWVTRGVGSAKQKTEWQRLHDAEKALQQIGVKLSFVNRVHSKSVTADDSIYCNGSFNWFSARRDGFANHETSFVYHGPALAQEIKALVGSLQQRVIRFQQSC